MSPVAEQLASAQPLPTLCPTAQVLYLTLPISKCLAGQREPSNCLHREGQDGLKSSGSWKQWCWEPFVTLEPTCADHEQHAGNLGACGPGLFSGGLYASISIPGGPSTRVYVCVCKGQDQPQALDSVTVVLAEDKVEAVSPCTVSTSEKPWPPYRERRLSALAWAVRGC